MLLDRFNFDLGTVEAARACTSSSPTDASSRLTPSTPSTAPARPAPRRCAAGRALADRSGRNVLSYGLLVFGVLALFGAALLGLGVRPLAPVALAVSAQVGIGGGWLAMARESEVGSGRPMLAVRGASHTDGRRAVRDPVRRVHLAFWGGLHSADPGVQGLPHGAGRVHAPETVAGAIMLPLVVGGMPFLIGLAIGVLGRWLAIRSYQRTTGRAAVIRFVGGLDRGGRTYLGLLYAEPARTGFSAAGNSERHRTTPWLLHCRRVSDVDRRPHDFGGLQGYVCVERRLAGLESRVPRRRSDRHWCFDCRLGIALAVGFAMAKGNLLGALIFGAIPS